MTIFFQGRVRTRVGSQAPGPAWPGLRRQAPWLSPRRPQSRPDAAPARDIRVNRLLFDTLNRTLF